MPEVGGLGTLVPRHAEAWGALGGHLSPEDVDFPRGQVNWRTEDVRFLLLPNPARLPAGWRDRIRARFGLRMRSPREFIAQQSANQAACPV